MRKPSSGQPAGLDAWDETRSLATHAGPDFALYVGDSLDCLAKLPDESINTVVTSPPYWAVRDYEHDEQLGLEDEVDDYVERLVKIFREVYRVLATDGSAWLNIGDSYFNKQITVGGKPPRTGWKRNKQLSLVPFRVALALQDDGWWIRNVAVWHKPNAMPASVRDRLTVTWEPVFLLTKSERYYFNLDEIRVPHQTSDAIERRRAESGTVTGKAQGKKELRKWLNSPRHRATIEGIKEVERRPNAPAAVELASYLRTALKEKKRSIAWVAEQLDLPFERTRHYFRTDEIGSRLPPPEVWEQLKDLLELDATYDEAMTVEVGDNVFRNHPNGKNPGDLLSIPTAPSGANHFAVMPRKLAHFALKATLPMNGSCLDPFMGSGTTGRVVRELGGRFVGVDVNEHYMTDYLVESGVISPETETLW
ncbi:MULTISPECIES: DNA-methyltransferase [Streptomyces]|uniref:Type II methyltransferase M.SfiI n=2 Tax=Streptomyces fimbriatus TaxID=68197 RepID=MTS1_STRFI|nr:RecName: Full=Type II methyltransferase M.SfiI; Short=M.SfiI; AltName: Full=Modification methylase SfiI; AltName: Full=N-4 cytosine-specific methyltransferase SfiI [Streptomyces fimbriatus]AAB95366.1 SfiI methyltransferase [Streptomyces fimbriatus]